MLCVDDEEGEVVSRKDDFQDELEGKPLSFSFLFSFIQACKERENNMKLSPLSPRAVLLSPSVTINSLPRFPSKKNLSL